MIRARSRLASLTVFLLAACVVVSSACVRTTNKDGSGGCTSTSDCESGSECQASVCVPVGSGGSPSSTGGSASDGGSAVFTGGTSSTGGSSSGGLDAGGTTGGDTGNATGGSAGSSSGGSTGGGDAGTGGTPGGGGSTGGASAVTEMIDDLEDGDGRISMTSGRQGPWHVFNSGDTGAGKPIMPEMGGANDSQWAMHTSGSGVTFAGVGFGLNNADSVPESAQSKAYDASEWSGVVFMAKAGSTGSASLRVEAPMRDFVPAERGGTCMSDCWNVYGFTVTSPLTTSWQEIRVPFSSMKREMGTTPAFDPKQIMTLSFKHTGNNDHFDFWIDDVRFYK